METALYLYTARIPIQFMAVYNSFWWRKTGRQPVKVTNFSIAAFARVCASRVYVRLACQEHASARNIFFESRIEVRIGEST